MIILSNLFDVVEFNHSRSNGTSVLNNCSEIQPWLIIDAYHEYMLKGAVPFLPYSDLSDLNNFNDILSWISLLNVKKKPNLSNIVSVVKFNYSSFCIGFSLCLFFFFFLQFTYLFMYLFIYFTYFGCAGSSLWRSGFSSCSALALEHTGSVVAARGLSCGMWDLSSPTRDWTQGPCIGSTES